MEGRGRGDHPAGREHGKLGMGGMAKCLVYFWLSWVHQTSAHSLETQTWLFLIIPIL